MQFKWPVLILFGVRREFENASFVCICLVQFKWPVLILFGVRRELKNASFVCICPVFLEQAIGK